MTMKRILQCTLIFMVLVTSGCDSIFGGSSPTPGANSSPPLSREQENKIDFEDAAKDVENAVTKLKSPAATVEAAKSEINKAIQKLGKDENDISQRCGNCNVDTKNGAVEVWKALKAISSKLGSDPEKKFAEFAPDVRTDLPIELSAEANQLKQLSTAAPKSTATTAVDRSTTSETKKDAVDPWWWGALILSGKIIAVLLALVLFVGTVQYLWHRSWKTLESNVGQLVKAHVVAARDGQPDYAPKLSSLASTQTEINSKLTELDTEVRSLARLIRDSLARRSDRNASYSSPNSYAEDVSPKDEPEFPVSAVNYLDKMNRFGNVVKPDFQNGILVNAPDGDGEFVLIRDSRDDTQPLFVIPRATQFHTKQDFYTYYQKYYDCLRPTAGDVWIIGPAVVEKVTGGWQLREKGMLEVR